MLCKWKDLAEKYTLFEQFLWVYFFDFNCISFRQDRLHTSCTIALVGKYTKLEDSYASVIKALRHAAIAVNRKLDLNVSYKNHVFQCQYSINLYLSLYVL